MSDPPPPTTYQLGGPQGLAVERGRLAQLVLAVCKRAALGVLAGPSVHEVLTQTRLLHHLDHLALVLLQGGGGTPQVSTGVWNSNRGLGGTG